MSNERTPVKLNINKYFSGIMFNEDSYINMYWMTNLKKIDKDL